MRHLIVIVVACTAYAGSLPYARWGMIDSPTAGVLDHSQIAVGGGFTAYGFQNPDSTDESDFALSGHIEVGLFDRVQAGVTYLGAAGISGQLRVVAFTESITRPGLAVGIENLTGETDYEFFQDDSLYHYPQSQNLSVYVVATKSLDYLAHTPICLNLGWGMGRFLQETEDDGFDNPIPGLFFAIEAHPVPSFSMTLEWDGRDANLGAQYSVSRHFMVRAAVAEFEQALRGDERDQTDVMQNTKITIGFEALLGPFFNRTTLEPTERLHGTTDEEALRQLEEERREALRQIEELLQDMQGE